MTAQRDRDYYTVPEAADLLNVSPSTVWRWVKAERLPAYRVGPRAIRIKKEDLAAVVRPAVWSSEVVRPHSPPGGHVFEPPTAEELARRREVVDRIMANRDKRNTAPLTTEDLIKQVREEREERYVSWFDDDR